jgi:hypothetical protein
MTVSSTDGVGLPVYGDEELKLHRFAFAVLGQDGKKLRVEEFAAWQLDASGLVTITRAPADQVGSAVLDVLATSLLDDDGLSDEYAPPDDEEIDKERQRGETLDQARERLTDPRLADREQWSSRRRFYAILESRGKERLHPQALNDLGEDLLKDDTGFPTGNSSPSSNGRRRSGRGSGGRR